jgi:hypothetical protein
LGGVSIPIAWGRKPHPRSFHLGSCQIGGGREREFLGSVF